MLYWSVFIYSIGYYFFVFFFFKQKTAYEMRISDWSSDVCSSDLIHQRGAGQAGSTPSLSSFEWSKFGANRLSASRSGQQKTPLSCCFSGVLCLVAGARNHRGEPFRLQVGNLGLRRR